ncbi:uncharacterized protein LOC113763564 [Coffea eugenioides]|uniref:uncharacterized protein LOC113763564 n=1 Tax=Coffea eugenioides TaxID=49369 RepID=UPI000F60866B|nr:uncharacterized protein LOC113763564 [Coffea eugenioides]
MVSVPQPPFFSPLKSISISASPAQKLQYKSIILALPSKNLKVSSSIGPSNAEPLSPNSSEKPLETDQSEGETDPVKLAFAKAKAYKKTKQSNPTPEIVQSPVQESAGRSEKSEELKLELPKLEALKPEDKGNGKEEVPLTLKLALEKAKEYRKNKSAVEESRVVKGSEQNSGIKIGNEGSLGGSVLRKDDDKKEELKISSIDFVGLDFSEKKSTRALPAGLVPAVDAFPEEDLPEVEILIGDASKFGAGAAAPQPIQEEDMDVYKPKVSTWGVFPRPSNISKTYGGGKNIRPGEVLETAADRATKEARTKQLLAAYESKIGLSIHPKLKSECEQALKEGDSLMDLGKLKEALPFYEQIMDKLAFQTELYGLAALQWSICQDSLDRSNEARGMYEKLQSHPNPQVSKKARQMNFGFQAMEMMKVTNSTLSPKNTGYQNYFDAFIRDKTNYPLEEAEVDEAVLSQALPYMILLLSPILIVVLIAAQKGLQS